MILTDKVNTMQSMLSGQSNFVEVIPCNSSLLYITH